MPDLFDHALLDRRRTRAAASGAATFLLERVAQEIAERLALVLRDFPLAVDLGSHEGTLARALEADPRIGTVVRLERNAALLRAGTGPRVQADPESLPLRAGSVDLIASALSLQFANDLPGALIQARRALKPDGYFAAAILGPSTLGELRQALLDAESEEGGAGMRVAPFTDVREAGTLMQRAGFALPVVDSETVTVRYGSALDLLRDLRAMGATNMLHERPRRPLKRTTLLRALSLYQEMFAETDGRVPARFEIVHMTGWAPHESQQKPLRPGSARTRLADALGVQEFGPGTAGAQEPPRGGPSS
jgi:NADH dehydrogenase [ubiquinone] 1 alpha subcomplex assembly factor 5